MSAEFEITRRGSEVEIQVRGTAEQEPRLIESFQDCQSGRCSCPTDQYERLESMTIESENGNTTMLLRPRSGEHLDTEQIQACLDYTVAQAEQG
jgi:hypothetical protein